jgi:two-component system chemotaxis response regulator CheB
VLLTGMGRDGADELKLMKDKGAITIAQNEESSVVYGMPKEAIQLDGASYVLSPNEIAPLLVSLVNNK